MHLVNMLNRSYKISISILLLLSAFASVQAQSKKAKPVAPPQAEQGSAADDRAKFRQEFIKATEEYKDSLKTLADSYEGNLKKLTEQNAKLKELYAEGIIARRELETSDNSVAEARLKVEEVRKQIAQVQTVLEAAVKGPSQAEVVNTQAAEMARVARPWTTGNRTVDNLIRYNGTRYGVDPYLIYCVMHQESRFGVTATSYKGAMGLMQLMPGTAARYGVTNPYDPAQSIAGGTRYLRDLLQLFNGRVDLALAGYNAGEGAVMKYGNRVPPYRETQNYVRTIGTRYGQNNHAVKPTLKAAPAKGSRKGK